MFPFLFDAIKKEEKGEDGENMGVVTDFFLKHLITQRNNDIDI